jgi:hypothetical protein
VFTHAIEYATTSTHNASQLATEDEREYFTVQLRDRFNNELDREFVSSSSQLSATLIGRADSCSNSMNNDNNDIISDTFVSIPIDITTAYPNTDGIYSFAYHPTQAGSYNLSVMLKTEGGLRATYYRQDDWKHAVIGNEDYRLVYPYHDPIWCNDEQLLTCDSTRLDAFVSFDWGFNSPLPNVSAFPSDHFSVIWDGFIQPSISGDYTIYIRSDYGAKVVIDNQVYINEFPLSKDEVSITVYLDATTYTPIQVYYQHNID